MRRPEAQAPRVGLPAPGPQWLDADAQRRLERHVLTASRRAHTLGEPVLAGVTRRLSGEVDPLAVVWASGGPCELRFVLEQPARHGSSVAGLGCALELTADGTDRFAQVARRWRSLAARAEADDRQDGAPGSGLAAFGGFSFAPEVHSPDWEGFTPASMVVPELALCRRDGVTWLTVNALVTGHDLPAEVLARVSARLEQLRFAPLPLLDPAPAGVYRVHSALAPAHHEAAVARAVAQIRAGELEKIVLAREVRVHAPRDYDPAAILGVLREGFAECFIYAVSRGDATFLGATPELLLRRDGQRASTVALAGSTRRSSDPAVDAHLGERLLQSAKDRVENAIVARRIAQVLAPVSLWVTAAPEPVVVKVANVQHLACPVRAQLAEPVSALELAGLLHPTPAVGGEPPEVAAALIPALEGFDRGWYAGAVGWIDASEDGEFCVALRCARLRGHDASCYAGGGIVAGSDPSSELAETEVKLAALLPILAG